MYCPRCGNEVIEGAKFCASCGSPVTQQHEQQPLETVSYTNTQMPQTQKTNKQPIFKKWWFWLIVVVVVIVAISSANTESDDEKNDKTSGLSISINEDKKSAKSTEKDAEKGSEKDADKKDSKVSNIFEDNKSDDNDDGVSTEYKNALEKAEVYSNYMHMSKQGIYDQLVSEYGEKFPEDAAQYAVDNIEADWNKNALEKAKTYYEDMNMSKDAVYNQLISEFGEKFTQSEAQYAVDHLE